MALRAWVVTDPSGEVSRVVFAETRGKARAAGVGEFGLGDWEFIEVMVCRASEFDGFADKGSVPREALLSEGWWFPCVICGEGRLDQDSITDGEAALIDGDIYCASCAAKLSPREAAQP